MDKKTICKIIKASGVSGGELVLVHFWGEDAERRPQTPSSHPLPPWEPPRSSCSRPALFSAKESSFNERYFDLFSKFDAVLDVFAYQPVMLGYQITNEQMDIYRRYMSQLFYRLTECGRFTQIRIPTQANAAESGLDLQDYIQRMTLTYDIDFEMLHAACRQKVEYLAGAWKVALSRGQTVYCSLN